MKEPVLARRVVTAVAGVWVLVLVICFAWRIGFALELEWMEGGSLHQALRLTLRRRAIPIGQQPPLAPGKVEPVEQQQ